MKNGAGERALTDSVTISVVVLDKEGEPVRNLKGESFHLFEEGKELGISSFMEIAGNPAAAVVADPPDSEGSAPNRGKVVLILFDDSHISGSQTKITRDSAEQYVRDHMRPQDLFAVGSFGTSLNVLQSFTHDAGRVLEAIRQTTGPAETPADINSSPTSAASRESRRMGQSVEAKPNTLLSYQADSYRAAPLLRALDSLNSALVEVKGRKALLLYSEDFSAGSSIQADFTRTVNSARKANVAYYIVDARGLNSLEGGGGGQGTGPLGSTASLGSTRARQGRGSDIEWNQFEKIPLENLLRPLAKETDGLAIYNTSNFNPRLDEVDRELSNYYLLGFQPTGPKRDGRFRTLEVKVDVKGATVKHPEGYQDPRSPDALAGIKEEKALLAALASPAPATQLVVTMRAAYLYESPGMAWIPVNAKIRAASVELRKKGGQLGCDLNIMGIAYAEDGAAAARFSESQHILIDKAAEDTFRKRNLVYRNSLRLRPGKYLVKLAVSDAQGKIGSTEQSLQIPLMPQSGLAASSLIVAEQVSRLPDLLQGLQEGMLKESDPLTFNGLQVSPSADNQLPINSPLQVFFKLYNLSNTPDRPILMARVQLLGEKGVSQTLPPTPLSPNLFATGKTEAMAGIPLRFDQLTPGKYQLAIIVSETATNQSITLQTDLEFRL